MKTRATREGAMPRQPEPAPTPNKNIVLRLRGEEYAAIRAAAERRAMTVTAYLRQLIRDAHDLNPKGEP